MVAPIRIGSGIRAKILDAGLMKIPVISTKVGAEGLLHKHMESILIANTPEDFVASIQLLKNERQIRCKIVENAYNLVREHYSVMKCTTDRMKIVDRMLNQ